MKSTWLFPCLLIGLITLAIYGCGDDGDTTPPVTTAKPLFGNATTVTLTANEPATIFYTTSGTPAGTTLRASVQVKLHADSLFGNVSTTTLNFHSVDTSGNIEANKTSGPYHNHVP